MVRLDPRDVERQLIRPLLPSKPRVLNGIFDLPTVKELIDRIMREAEQIIDGRLERSMKG